MLTKFLDIISRYVQIDPVPDETARKLSELSLEKKVYLENLRRVLGVPEPVAKLIVESAVRQGVFRRGIEILCPDEAVGKEVDNEAEIPTIVECWNQQEQLFEELPTGTLKTRVFYKLTDKDVAIATAGKA